MKIDKESRVLIVDDNAKIRKLLLTILKSIGYENITEAVNGKNAWELFQADPFQLVLTDWMMPEMDGFELLKNIRKGPEKTKDVPVFMITSSDDSEDIRNAAQYAVSGYIVKPFSVKTIITKLNAFSAKQ